MSVKCVSEMIEQALNLNRCYVGELISSMRIVANSHIDQKAVLRNKSAAVRCMQTHQSACNMHEFTVTPSMMYKTISIELWQLYYRYTCRWHLLCIIMSHDIWSTTTAL